MSEYPNFWYTLIMDIEFLKFLVTSIGLGFFFAIPVIVIFGAPIYIPFFIRWYRIKQLAKSFGLTYRNGIKFKWASSFPEEDNRYSNIIEGNLNNKKVLIRDYFSGLGFGVPFRGPLGQHGRFGKRSTLLTIDGEVNKINGGIMGYAPVSLIKKTLDNIERGEEIEHAVDVKSWSFNLILLLWIVIWAGLLLGLFYMD